MTIDYDALALEVARKYEQENIKGMSFCDTAEELCRRYRSALAEKMVPVAFVVADPKGSFGVLFEGLPAGTSLYSLEDWKK